MGEFGWQPLLSRVLVGNNFHVWHAVFDFLDEPGGCAAGVGELPFSYGTNRCDFPQQGFTIPAVGAGWSADEDEAAGPGVSIWRGHAIQGSLGDEDVLLTGYDFEIVSRNEAEVEPRHGQTGFHHYNACRAVFASQPQQGKMGGVTCSDD